MCQSPPMFREVEVRLDRINGPWWARNVATSVQIRNYSRRGKRPGYLEAVTDESERGSLSIKI